MPPQSYIQVCVSAEARERIKDLSRRSRISMSALIQRALEIAEPQLIAAVERLERARDGGGGDEPTIEVGAWRARRPDCS